MNGINRIKPYKLNCIQPDVCESSVEAINADINKFIKTNPEATKLLEQIYNLYLNSRN